MTVVLRMFVLAFAFMLASTAPAAAEDVLHFHNGDRLTGTVERIQRGVVHFSVPAIDGPVSVGWNLISRIDSPNTYQFILADGRVMVGELGTPSPDEPDVFVIEGQTSRLSVPRDEIVYVSQNVGSSSGRLEADVGGGFNIAKSNDHRQINTHGLVEYETPSYFVAGRFNSLFANQQSETNTNRFNVTGSFGARITQRWSALTFADFLTSEEQRLDRRVVAGGGPMRDLITNNQIELRTFGGVVWNNELFLDTAPGVASNQVEALGGITASFFRFKQVNFDTTLYVYPSLSDAGRARLDWRSALRLRLVPGQPFWLNFNQTYTYDSRPPAQSAGTDYVTSTSISWIFP